MADLSNFSLAELRDAARRLDVEGAGALAKRELLEKLAPRAAEASSLLEGGVSRGSFVFRESTSGMTNELPRAGRPDEQAPDALRSGSGHRDEVPLEPPKIFIPDLPWAYDDDRVVLLVRDPRTLYAYWDIDPRTVENGRRGLVDAKSVLRVWRLGGAEPTVAGEFDIDLGWKSFYVYDNEPNHDYRVEVIFRGADGQERLLARPSNVASLPANRPSAWVEDRFVSIPLDRPLPGTSLFAAGRHITDLERRLHGRAFELSGGEVATGDEASSSAGIAQGFGGRGWSGTMVKK